MEFARTIRELRRSKDWSVYDLADRIGKTAGYISKIEARGEIPSPDMVIKLAEALGADPEKLVGLAKNEKAKEISENVLRKYDDAYALHRRARRR